MAAIVTTADKSVNRFARQKDRETEYRTYGGI